ncbi:MAG: FKBP-type peptidyl-prolyl cis-trans isomerase [Bacteroidetes bacterium]|nr:FKBP-type peptidyl-prolyl cis-trans isomerase [Bacteroidota bacterium]
MKTFFALGIMILLLSCSEESIPESKQQLQKDIQLVDSYLAEKNIAAEIDSRGYRYVVSNIGSSFKPVLEDSVIINYTTIIMRGDTINKNVTGTFLLSKLIKAIQYQLPNVGEGATLELYIPSGLAYGAYPAGAIPRNSNLIIHLKLVKVIPEYTKQLLRDIASIDDYLADNSITALKDVSGLRYKITQPPKDANTIAPLASDSVVIYYTGKILSTGAVFYQSTTPESYRLNKTGTLKVWQKGLVFFKEGTKAILYAPSGLAYGSYEKYGVPPNTNVVFEVEIQKVISK